MTEQRYSRTALAAPYPFLIIAAGVIWMLLVAQDAYSNNPAWFDYSKVGFKVQALWDFEPGPAELEFTIWADSDAAVNSYKVWIKRRDVIELPDPGPWPLSLAPGDTTIFNISVVIPPDTISRIEVDVDGGRPLHRMGIPLTFKAWDDTATYSYGWQSFAPQRFLDSLRALGCRSARERSDSINAERERIFEELKDGPRVVRTVMGKDGKWYNIDSLPPDFEVWSEPDDTAGIWYSHMDDTSRCWAKNEEDEWVRADRDSLMRAIEEQKIERQWSRLRAREQQPCMVGAEVMSVDGKEFVRRKGEVKFHEARPLPDGKIPADSMKYYRAPSRFHVVVDLSKPGDSALMLNIVDSLVPFDSAHLYHFEVDRMQMQEVENSGVPYNFYPYVPVEESDSADWPSAGESQGAATRQQALKHWAGAEPGARKELF